MKIYVKSGSEIKPIGEVLPKRTGNLFEKIRKALKEIEKEILKESLKRKKDFLIPVSNPILTKSIQKILRYLVLTREIPNVP